jgi:ketosteroid isomerase-like protein
MFALTLWCILVTPPATESAAVERVLDAWHAAAAQAKEEDYFAHLSERAIFLGTDATERWTKAEFRKFAAPHFAKGKAWSFTATRRHVMFSDDQKLAWFDEDLRTGNLGPCRGSGVLVREGSAWKIIHYNLAITVPNDKFAAVKQLLAGDGK